MSPFRTLVRILALSLFNRCPITIVIIIHNPPPSRSLSQFQKPALVGPLVEFLPESRAVVFTVAFIPSQTAPAPGVEAAAVAIEREQQQQQQGDEDSDTCSSSSQEGGASNPLHGVSEQQLLFATQENGFLLLSFIALPVKPIPHPQSASRFPWHPTLPLQCVICC